MGSKAEYDKRGGATVFGGGKEGEAAVSAPGEGKRARKKRKREALKTADLGDDDSYGWFAAGAHLGCCCCCGSLVY